MSNSDLPNLHALRVFEAAARTGSLTAAAEELSVTQSAVSKQVAQLEAQLGTPLFERHHRRVTLNARGRDVADTVAQALGTLRAGLGRAPDVPPSQIRVVADADFAQLWLFARLPAFEAAHPGIRVSLQCVIGLETPPAQDHDLAVIWGRGTWRNCRFEPLLSNSVFPVAAPGFFAHLSRPPRPGDVTSDMLIHDQTTHWWSAFRAVTAATSFDPGAGRLYNQTALCLEAAMRGDGITLRDEVTSAQYLADGRLVCPFAHRLPSPDAYYITSPSNQSARDEIRALTAWLHAEAEAHRRWWQAWWD